jgi:replicative DNA helicase
MENKQKKKLDHNTLNQMLLGKKSPSAVDLEKNLIGIMLMFPDPHVFDCRLFLKATDFYDETNRKVVKAIYELSTKSQPVTILTVTEELRAAGELEKMGGPYYLVACTQGVVNNYGFDAHMKIVKQYAMARHLISFAVGVIEKSTSEDIFDSLDFAQQKLYEMFEEIKIHATKDITAIVVDTIKSTLEELNEEDFVLTGFPEWDKINGPLQPSLYVLAARPGMGKTAFVVELLMRMCLKHNVLLINGEMSDRQIIRRCISNLMSLNSDVYKLRPETWSEDIRKVFIEGAQRIGQMKLHVFSDSMELMTIINTIRFYKRKFGIKAVAIDFIQMVTIAESVAKYMPKSERLEYAMNLLREVAKQENVSIFVLSQLNREVTKRQGSKRPGMADLKGSGALEEYAFQISFLHRPEYYEADGLTDEMGESVKGLAYQFIEKHRDGILEDLKYRFHGQYSQFKEWEDEFTKAKWNPMQVVQNTYTNAALDELDDDEAPF